MQCALPRTTALLALAAFAAASHAQLVINEVDYDQAGTDAASFIEIKNNRDCPISLTDLAVVYINGNNNLEYGRVLLSAAGAQLVGGQYLVIRNAAVTVLPGALTIDVNGDFLQNGAPDGLALVNTATFEVIDTLSYEGIITAASINGFPFTVNLVRGSPFTIPDTNDNLYSLARVPDGLDSNNDLNDWQRVTSITPGAPNSGTSQPLVLCCGNSDFNGDGDFGTDADIEAFFACLAGNCCPTCFPGGSDFNQDGDFGTDADIESFFRVLGGGGC